MFAASVASVQGLIEACKVIELSLAQARVLRHRRASNGGTTMRWILSAVFLFVATAAHAAPPPPPGSLCAAVMQFIEAPAPETRVRTLLLYPTDPNATGLVTLAIEATPDDGAADALARNLGGRTWRGGLIQLGRDMSSCFPGTFGGRFTFAAKPFVYYDLSFRFGTFDGITGRSIRIEAEQKLCPEALRAQLTRNSDLCLRVTVKGK